MSTNEFYAVKVRTFWTILTTLGNCLRVKVAIRLQLGLVDMIKVRGKGMHEAVMQKRAKVCVRALVLVSF